MRINNSNSVCVCNCVYACRHNINGQGGTIYVVIHGPAGPLMYPDQISRYSTSIGPVLHERCFVDNMPVMLMMSNSTPHCRFIMMPCNIGQHLHLFLIGQDGGHDGIPEHNVQLMVSKKIV